MSLNLFCKILVRRHVVVNRFLDIRMYSKSMFAIALPRIGLCIQYSRSLNRQTAICCWNKSTFYFRAPTTIKVDSNANVVHQPHPQITATLPMKTTVRRAKCNFSSILVPLTLFLLVCAPFTTIYKNRLITFSSTFLSHSAQHDQHSGENLYLTALFIFSCLEQFFDLFSRHTAHSSIGAPAPWQNRKLNSANHAVLNQLVGYSGNKIPPASVFSWTSSLFKVLAQWSAANRKRIRIAYNRKGGRNTPQKKPRASGTTS